MLASSLAKQGYSTPPRGNVRIRRPMLISVPSAQTVSDDSSWSSHTVYVILVKWSEKQTWIVSRRYSDFAALHDTLEAKFSNLPQMPPKTWFPVTSRLEIQARRKHLETYLRRLLSEYKVYCNIHVRKFLHFHLFRDIWDDTFNRKEDPMAPPVLPKASIDDFRVLALVGKGSYARVYQVQHEPTGKIYAMKILEKNELVQRKQVEHTQAERKILENIDHPFIVSLRYAFQTRKKLYMLFDFFEGGELFFHLRNGRFSEHRARFYVAEVLLALECLHSKGIIYRDLKPENVLLDNEGHIRLTDFGLSKNVLDTTNRLTHTFCGTPHYLAPEVIKGKAYGHVVDWWSLGTLLFELLTGLPPFYDKSVNKMYKKILKGTIRYPDFISPTAKQLIVKLLNHDPESRLGYNGADEIKANPFFAGLRWDLLAKRQLRPPFKPKTKDALSNVDASFKYNNSLPDPIGLHSPTTQQEKALFPGFTYTESLEDKNGEHLLEKKHSTTDDSFPRVNDKTPKSFKTPLMLAGEPDGVDVEPFVLDSMMAEATQMI